MAAYKTGAFVHLKYYTPLKWIPLSKITTPLGGTYLYR